MSRLEENNLKKKLMHNGTWMYIFAFLIAPSGYLLKMMIAREVALEDIGIFYAILGFITMLSSYNDLGLTEALQYFLPKYLLNKEQEKAASLTRFVRLTQFFTGVILCGGLYLLAPWLTKHYFSAALALPLLQIFSLYFLIINLYQVLASLFFATQQVKRAQTIDFIRMRSIVAFTGLSIFSFDGFSILGYTRFWLGGVLLGIIAALIGVVKLYPRVFNTSLLSLKKHLYFKERLSYGWRTMLGQSTGILYIQINQQLVLLIMGAAEAGIWAYYLAFFSITHVISGPIVGYLFPLLNELYEKKDQQKIKQLYTYLAVGLVAFGIIGGVTAYHLSPSVAVLLFGPLFREAGELFRVFAPWIWTIPLIGIVFADIASRGWVKERVFALLFGVVILFISTYIGIQYYGIIGSVYGNIIGTLAVLLGISFIYIKKGVTPNMFSKLP